MAIIKTGSHPKTLWPGMKAAWEAAYKGTKAVEALDYYCVKINDRVDTEEEANLYVQILNDAIDILAIDNPVYVIVEPKVYIEKPFDTREPEYHVGCRFSVGDPKIVGKVGKIISGGGSYDDKLVTGFGLAPIRGEGVSGIKYFAKLNETQRR